GGGGPRRPPRGARSEADHHALFAPGRDPGRARRVDPHLPGRRRGVDDGDVWRVPGRAHGRARRRGGVPEHDQPQLSGPHGPPEGAGLSLEPGGGCRERGGRRAHPPERGPEAPPGGGQVTPNPAFVREIAPVAIRGAGISLVIADSYARIFFRNAINMGYPILQSPQAAEAVQEGDELEVDLEEGIIRNFTKGDEYRCEAFPQFMNELLRMGGLVPWVRKQLEERRRARASSG